MGQATLIRAIAGFSSEEQPEEQVSELGLVADTLKSCSKRMGVGQFERLVMRAEDGLVLVSAVGDPMTGFYFGQRPSRQSDCAMFRAHGPP